MDLRDNELCYIVGKGDVVISLSNDLILELRNIRYVMKLERNLISVDQLTYGGMKSTLDSDVCMITKGGMVMAHGKKEGTLYITSGFGASILVASSEVNAGVWH